MEVGEKIKLAIHNVRCKCLLGTQSTLISLVPLVRMNTKLKIDIVLFDTIIRPIETKTKNQI